MAAKANSDRVSRRKTKQVAKKAAEKTSRPAKKKSSANKKSSVAKKAVAKKSVAKKSTTRTRQGASKQGSAKRGTAKPAGKRRGHQADPSTAAEIDVDVLDQIDELVADPSATKKARPAATKKRKGPSTPTVPRSVKPAPKFADLEMDPELLAFIHAIDKYKQDYSRPFPSWHEVFYVLRMLGYEKC